MRRLITYRHLNEYEHMSGMVRIISTDLRSAEIECDTYHQLKEELIRMKISENEIISIVKIVY